MSSMKDTLKKLTQPTGNRVQPSRGTPIVLKTKRELEMMRHTGKVGFDILTKMAAAVAPGVTTWDLNEIARIELERNNAIGLSKNYPEYKPNTGYPAETCISVNEVVVHGIPNDRALQNGDIVTLDLALSVNGYCTDSAITVPVGPVAPTTQKLLEVTKGT